MDASDLIHTLFSHNIRAKIHKDSTIQIFFLLLVLQIENQDFSGGGTGFQLLINLKFASYMVSISRS